MTLSSSPSTFSSRLFSSLATAGLLLAAGCGGADPGAGPVEGSVSQADTQAKGVAPVTVTGKTFTPNQAGVADASDELGLGPDQSFSLVLLWGHLTPLASAPSAPTVDALAPRPVMTWAGSMRVVEGEITVERTIDAHGQAGDVQVSPQSPQIVNFTAHTGSNVEGALIHVRVPAKHRVVLFTTPQLTAFVDLRTLAASPGHQVAMDDGVHGLVWAGFRDDGGCDRRGFLYGAWTESSSGAGGQFGASVFDEHGQDVGRASGAWQAQDQSFSGQVIGAYGTPVRTLNGKIDSARGQLSGSWGPTSGSTGQGTVDGIFRAAHGDGMGPGVWLGRWTETCAAGG